MNERIEELMKQAMEPSGLESLGGPYMELNPEKFAELIVKECVDIIADAVDHREPASTYVGRIKQHFGVKS